MQPEPPDRHPPPPQKRADGRPPVAAKNLRVPAAAPSPETEEPPDGGPPSIRRWNLRETTDGRRQPTTNPRAHAAPKGGRSPPRL